MYYCLFIARLALLLFVWSGVAILVEVEVDKKELVS
jgi:hypothetical protein